MYFFQINIIVLYAHRRVFGRFEIFAPAADVQRNEVDHVEGKQGDEAYKLHHAEARVHKGGINHKIPNIWQERQLLELGRLLVAESHELGGMLENS